MRRTDQLITQVRRETENVDYGTTYGIPQEEFIQYLNDAQDQLQGVIMRSCSNCTWFHKQVIVPLVANQTDYELPADCYMTNNIRLVEFSENSQTNYYEPLDRINFQNTTAWAASPPNAYTIYKNYIKLSPAITSALGSLRITYHRRLPKLDLPRGTITSYTSGTKALLLNNDSYLDTTNLNTAMPTYLSFIRGVDGEALAYAVNAASINTGTRTITLNDHPTYEGSFTITDALNQFVTIGEYSTCIPQLPEECERYLLSYCAWKIFKRDASDEAKLAGEQLTAIEGNIISALNAPESDYKFLPMEF